MPSPLHNVTQVTPLLILVPGFPEVPLESPCHPLPTPLSGFLSCTWHRPPLTSLLPRYFLSLPLTHELPDSYSACHACCPSAQKSPGRRPKLLKCSHPPGLALPGIPYSVTGTPVCTSTPGPRQPWSREKQQPPCQLPTCGNRWASVSSGHQWEPLVAHTSHSANAEFVECPAWNEGWLLRF